MQHYQIHPIGVIHITEKGTEIQLKPEYIPALWALDGFSHLNIIWWCSESDTEEARSTLQVPKPYQKAPDIMGVFATRSPARPNPLALSTVEIIAIDKQKGRIQLAYIDAFDQSPVLDIKPYTPSLDRVESPTVPQWCSHWPQSLEQSEEFDWENEFLL